MTSEKEEVVESDESETIEGSEIKRYTLKEIDPKNKKITEKPIVTGYRNTGNGNALRLIEYFGEKLRYSEPVKRWFVWDGKRWKRDESLKIFELCKETANRIYNEAAFLDSKSERKEIEAWGKHSESAYALHEMEQLARSDARMRILPDEFDARHNLINFPNGTLDLDTREFREHRREDMLSRITKVPYIPLQKSQYFYKTLLSALPADVTVYLQRVLGSMLAYTAQNKEILLLYGKSYAGKSSLTQAVYNGLGEYSASFPKEVLEKTRQSIAANAARPELMALEGIRIAWTEETSSDMIFDEAIFRSLTSSGVKSARNIFERQREIHIGASYVIETNSPPVIAEIDPNSRIAMLDRILVAPFLKSIPPEKRDKNVLRKMTNDEDELTVAVAWVIQGYFDRVDQGLQIPDSVIQGKDTYEMLVNPLFDFVKEEVIFDSGLKDGTMHHETQTLSMDLYEKFKENEGLEGVRAVGNIKRFDKHFSNLIPYFEKQTGIKAVQHHVREGSAWDNVRLRAEDDVEVIDTTPKAVVNNTMFETKETMNLLDYYNIVHTSSLPVHVLTGNIEEPVFEPVSDLPPEPAVQPPEHVDTPVSPERTPPQVEVALAVYNILRQFRNAGGSRNKLTLGYDDLRSAICDTIRKDRPEWASNYDLEGSYDHLCKNDPKIEAIITDLTNKK